MLHHVSVGVTDVERAARFYDAVMAALGYKRIMEFLPHALAYGENAPSFWVQRPNDGGEASVGNGTHIGFTAATRAAVDAFHAAALAAGGSDNGPPGPRPNYSPEYYGAFVLDLDGNRIEAVLYPMGKAKAKQKLKSKTMPKAKKAKAKAATKAKKKTRPGAKRKTAKAKRTRKK